MLMHTEQLQTRSQVEQLLTCSQMEQLVPRKWAQQLFSLKGAQQLMARLQTPPLLHGLLNQTATPRRMLTTCSLGSPPRGAIHTATLPGMRAQGQHWLLRPLPPLASAC